MAITSTLTTSFKTELLTGTHNFTNSSGDTFKLALYTSSATMGATTTAFTTSQEASGTNYTSGGGTLVNVTPSATGTTAVTDFNDLTFSTATVTARGCKILVEIKLLLLETLLLYFQQKQRPQLL